MSVLLAQLTNVYVSFFLLETVLLRVSSDLRVWRAFLACALVADVGHLIIVARLGVDVGWRVWELGVADWAKPGIMILGRGAFLMGWGMSEGRGKRKIEGKGEAK